MHHLGHESKLAPRFNHQKKIRSLLQAALFWSTRARHRPDQELAVHSGLPLDPNFSRKSSTANDESSLYSRHTNYLS